jgi:hypothetical protein
MNIQSSLKRTPALKVKAPSPQQGSEPASPLPSESFRPSSSEGSSKLKTRLIQAACIAGGAALGAAVGTGDSWVTGTLGAGLGAAGGATLGFVGGAASMHVIPLDENGLGNVAAGTLLGVAGGLAAGIAAGTGSGPLGVATMAILGAGMGTFAAIQVG